MSKEQFIKELNSKLKGYPKKEVEDRLNFYIEMIDDRIEDGILEEDAVSMVGTVDEVYKQIVSDIPLSKIAIERLAPKRNLKALEVVLLVFGAPIWLSLIIALFAVVVSLYAALWAVIISLYACVFALAISGVGAVVYSVLLFITNSAVTGLAVLGAGLALCGVSILLYYFSALVSKGAIYLIKALSVLVKKAFVRRES